MQNQHNVTEPAVREALSAAGVHAYTYTIPAVLAIHYKASADADRVIAWVQQLRERGAIPATTTILTVAHEGLLLAHRTFERLYPGSVLMFDGHQLSVLTEDEFGHRYRATSTPTAVAHAGTHAGTHADTHAAASSAAPCAAGGPG